MKASEKIPAEIDYSLFRWLRKGDRLTIAKDTKKSVSMVSATLRKETYNEDIIHAAMRKVVERMKKVLEQQAEAKRLQQLMK